MSKLYRFKYLQLRQLVILTIILSLVSTLFSLTAFSFLGYYKSFNAYLGEEDNVVAIYDAQSRTPFTGIVPAYLTDKISQVNGVLACSPEAITPCIILNQSLFIRGILPEEFCKLTPITMVEGDFLNLSSLNSVVLGKNVADRLNLRLNDEILVLATLADRYLELQVTGVFLSHSGMDDEALVQLNVGQWLRFNDYNSVTLIRAQINPAEASSSAIYQVIAKNISSNQTAPSTTSPHTKYQDLIPWTAINFPIAKIKVEDSQNVVKSYLDRYGITKEALIVLSVMVFFFSSTVVVVASQTLVLQHKEDLATLRSLGVSRRGLRVDVLCKVLPLSLVASVLGILMTMSVLWVLGNYGFLQVLSHRVNFVFDPLVLMLNFVLLLVLVSVSISSSDFR